MIVVDENIHGARIRNGIAVWYPGQVVSIVNLRPTTTVKDDGVATLLRLVSEPTFVTINVTDFWLQLRADRHYCIVGFVLAQERAIELPGLLRKLFRLPAFHTKAARMGKVIRVAPTTIEYYAADRQIHTIPWSE